MAVHEQSHRRPGFQPPSWTGHWTTVSTSGTAASASNDTHSARAYAFASLRLVTGFAFLWAFLDKTFGFGYATSSGKGWIDGGSSVNGLVSGAAAGPVEATFHDWAGETWAGWLFAAGLLGIGIALVGGIALRPAALVGTVMMVLMWIAEWPPAQHFSDGSVGMSANVFMDYHVIYAAVLIALVLASAGDTWGFGKQWAKLPFVRENGWLR